MYILSNDNKDIEPVESIKATTFRELNMLEADLEEIIRKHADIICGDEEDSLLIIGQQVIDATGGRNDLVALDQNGNLVLIELKRDRADMQHRSEPLEVQAIRYAASCATISTNEELLQKLFIPYIEKHNEEFHTSNITTTELAQRKLDEFISINNITSLNEKQRIILVASKFDDRTLSATAWLCSNGIDIACYQITPYTYKLDNRTLLDVQRILPLQAYSDFYSVFRDNSQTPSQQGRTVRQKLPRIDELLEAGVVKSGDILYPKNHKEEQNCYVELQESGLVKTKDGKVVSLLAWLKSIYDWAAIQTYYYAMHADTDKSLDKLRSEYLARTAQGNNED